MYGGTGRRRRPGPVEDGLSPRVRGNHDFRLQRPHRFRSIPACTGEPRIDGDRKPNLEVYPRVYGGTPIVSSIDCNGTGLSPRVRGNLVDREIRCSNAGSIPACTGEPQPGSGCTRRCWVYPRVYGGTHSSRKRNRNAGGLSPRVRGNRASTTQEPSLAGSIPACTGEPVWCGLPSRKSWVYPRVYGGTHGKRRPDCNAPGLSPRVRGNHAALLVHAVVDGSIPACTGEPE